MPHCGSAGNQVGGTEVTSACVDRDMFSCHAKGNTISSPTISRTSWVPQRRRERSVVRVSLIVHPPALHAELEEREDADDRQYQQRDHGGVALVVLAERLGVEQVD